jgi:hypothetical protein
MTVIWKYPLDIQYQQGVAMPRGAKILRTGLMQYDDDTGTPLISIWAMVEPNVERVNRRIYIRGTGGELPLELNGETQFHIATVPMVVSGRTLIWHVFDGGER